MQYEYSDLQQKISNLNLLEHMSHLHVCMPKETMRNQKFASSNVNHK